MREKPRTRSDGEAQRTGGEEGKGTDWRAGLNCSEKVLGSWLPAHGWSMNGRVGFRGLDMTMAEWESGEKKGVKAQPDITEGSSHSMMVTSKKQRETGKLRIKSSVQIRGQEGGGHLGECSRTSYSMKCSGFKDTPTISSMSFLTSWQNLGSHKWPHSPQCLPCFLGGTWGPAIWRCLGVRQDCFLGNSFVILYVFTFFDHIVLSSVQREQKYSPPRTLV